MFSIILLNTFAKDIINYEEKIVKAQEDIKLNEQQQIEMTNEIDKQKAVVTRIKEKQESVD